MNPTYTHGYPSENQSGVNQYTDISRGSISRVQQRVSEIDGNLFHLGDYYDKHSEVQLQYIVRMLSHILQNSTC